MPSFDIVNKIDLQKIDNAVNTAKKELLNRYDLKDELCAIELDKKGKQIRLEAKQDMAMQTLIDIVLSKFSKQGLDVRCLDLSKEPAPSGRIVLQEVKIKEGLEKETAKKIVSFIKGINTKVQPAIHEDQVRVSGKKIDDLQDIIATLRGEDFEVPLQFENFRA
ncbi:MAG: YajQ family cyclic di-GMP-binding protein [Bacteroidetes bacterium]|nr:YajQ family cyclic di-GMP-binding protein [Bacteroidota bacterium]